MTVAGQEQVRFRFVRIQRDEVTTFELPVKFVGEKSTEGIRVLSSGHTRTFPLLSSLPATLKWR